MLATSMAHWLLPFGPLKCRIDPGFPTGTSTTHLEHILHIPAVILQASVGNILSVPGQHCRPTLNSRGHNQGQGKEKHREKTVGKRGVILQIEENQHR